MNKEEFLIKRTTNFKLSKVSENITILLCAMGCHVQRHGNKTSVQMDTTK